MKEEGVDTDKEKQKRSSVDVKKVANKMLIIIIFFKGSEAKYIWGVLS